MTDELNQTGQGGASRRDFLRGTTAAVLGALAAVPNAHAAGDDTIRVGLIGCGGRGTGAAINAMNAGKDITLVAMGDMFRERLDESRAQLKREGGDRFDVPEDRCFVGFDAYKQVLDSGVDVVLLAAPPGFRPLHVKAAVEAGKHVFAEKPVAVDAPGVRAVIAACEAAKTKGLAVGSGLCWRYDEGMRQTFQRIHDGAIGKIVALQCTYNVQEAKPPVPRQPGWSDIEWQIRNWYYFTWLSGDHNVEQHVHSLDKMAWAMKDQYPVRATGLGGRQCRTKPEYGNIFDHHAVCYEFADGTRCFSECRQQPGTATEVTDYVFGSTGTATLLGQPKYTIRGESPWRFRPSRGATPTNMYQQEHDELFASIREGKPINDGEWMSKSTLMAIMGRMATYTGQVVTWDQAWNSSQDLSPPTYAFGPFDVPPVAIPGVTKLV